MKGWILELIDDSIEGSNTEKILECIWVLREGCIFEEESELFNNFLISFKKNIKNWKNYIEIWTKMKEK